jgi:transposase-like protein
MDRADKVEKAAVGRKEPGVHTAQEKCRAVLSVWTEKRKAAEVCRELGVPWGVLSQWQERAMEGMLQALTPRGRGEQRREVALSERLAVLLERKSGLEGARRMGRRVKRQQESASGKAEEPARGGTEKKAAAGG